MVKINRSFAPGKQIVFTRHAESLANAGFATLDAHSITLSPKGFFQAERLAKNFPIVPELIVVSTFLRTQQTAAPLISKISGVIVEIWDMVHEFTYLDREKHKNTTGKERKEFVLQYWNRQDPFYKDGPEEESFFELLLRAEKLLNSLKERREKSIAVFSHGQFLTSLKVCQRLDVPLSVLTEENLVELMNTFKVLQDSYPIENAVPMTWEELVR